MTTAQRYSNKPGKTKWNFLPDFSHEKISVLTGVIAGMNTPFSRQKLFPRQLEYISMVLKAFVVHHGQEIILTTNPKRRDDSALRTKAS